jgi:hypothetical protein
MSCRRQRLDIELFQQVLEARLLERAVDDDAHRALRCMGAHKDHALHEARIGHAGHGNEQLPGQEAVAPGPFRRKS